MQMYSDEEKKYLHLRFIKNPIREILIRTLGVLMFVFLFNPIGLGFLSWLWRWFRDGCNR